MSTTTDEERGERVAEMRAARALTQAEVAAAVGVSVRTVWGWEHGAEISRGNASLLAGVYGVTPGEILTGVPDRGSPRELDAIVERLGAVERDRDELREDVSALRTALEEILLLVHQERTVPQEPTNGSSVGRQPSGTSASP